MYFLGRWPWPTLCGGWVRITNCILDMHLSVLWCAHHQRCVHDGEAKTMHKATQTQTQTHTHTLTLTLTHTHTPTNTNSVKHLTSKPVLAGKCHCASHKTVVASIGCLCHRKIKTCAQPVLAPKSLLVFCLPFPRPLHVLESNGQQPLL